MLRVLRQGGVGQALMAMIVFAIIAVFLLEFRTSSRMQTGSLRQECAARIAGECVTPKDYYAEFGLVVPRGMPAKQTKTYSLRKHVLDGVIERELLVSEARRLGLSTDDEAVKRELRLGRAHVSLPASHALQIGHMLDLVTADETGLSRYLVRELPIFNAKTQEVDDDLYSRVVRSMTNRSPKEFLKMQERELLASRMRDLVRARVRVSEEEAFDAYQREKSTAVARFVRLDSNWFERWATDATDAGIDRWAEAHRSEIDAAWKTESAKFKADCPLGSEIVATFPPEASEAQKSLLQDKIDRAKTLLDGGRPFEIVAREVSDGPTAHAGGQIGCVTPDAYGDGGDVLAKAVGALTPGGVSAVLASKKGYHLVRLDGRLAAGDVEAVGRRAVARPLAVRATAEEAAKDFAKRLTQAAQGGARLDDTTTKLVPEYAKAWLALEKGDSKAKPDAEGDAAADAPPMQDARAPKAEVSAPFGIDGDPVPGAFGGPPLGRLVFDLAKPDDVPPEPIQIAGGLVVLQLKEKTVATREEFDKTKAEVLKKLQIAKQSDALVRYVARLRQAQQAKIEINERLLEEPKASDQD